MEYVYSALVLHSAGKEINEAQVTNVLKAAGVEADASRVKALVASLDGVNIAEAIEKAAFAPAAPAAGPAPSSQPEAAKKEEKKEEAGPTEEEAAAGLGALFG